MPCSLALLWLSHILRDGKAQNDPKRQQHNQWKTIVAFAAGVPLGARGISQVIDGIQSGSMLPLLAIGFLTGFATFPLARKFRH